MVRRIIPLICLILVSSLVLGEGEDLTYIEGQFATEAIFDLGADGNARMTITEPLYEEFDEVTLAVTADESNMLTIGGVIIDDASAYEPDFTLSISGNMDSAQMTMEISGNDISDLLAEFGDFELDMDMSESGNVLNIDVSGHLSRDFIENELLIDADELAQDANELKASLEEMLNLAFSVISTPSPNFRISELNIQSGSRVDFSIKIGVENWRNMYSQLLSESYMEGSEELKFMYCVGISPDAIAQDVLASQLGRISVVLKGLGNKISLDMTMSGFSYASGGDVSITDMDLTVSKSGDRMDINGRVGITNLQTVVSCLLEDYIEGEYTVDDLRLMISKSGDSTGTTTLEGNLRDFAKKSGERWRVTIPEEVTEDIAVTVNIPQGMEVFSLKGATGEGNSLKSKAGEEMMVVYGESKPVIGDNIWIILIVVVFLLAFFFLRGKKR